jgi:L-ascorbate metabolism protein UlaG (beta-lactamase superfamily)
VQITWLGHGSFQFRLPSGQVILMDPWTDGNPSYPKGHTIDRVDTIRITHWHFDHIHDALPLVTASRNLSVTCPSTTGEGMGLPGCSWRSINLTAPSNGTKPPNRSHPKAYST